MKIDKNIIDITKESTQSNPDCFLRFLHFSRRDTRNYINRRPEVIVKEPGIKGIRHGKNLKNNDITDAKMTDIASDILSCSVTKSKSSAAGGFVIILSSGDINYHHLIHPGDHVLIWMKRNRINPMVKQNKSIFNNKIDSGLKMHGVVTDVRRYFRTAADGRKILRYRISGKDIGYYFEAQVYYNYALAAPLAAFQVFNWLLKSKLGLTSTPLQPDDIIKKILLVWLGSQPPSTGTASRSSTPNDVMLLPTNINSVFKGDMKTVYNLLQIRTGIEKYSSGLEPDAATSNKPQLQGMKIFSVDIGNQTPIWELLRAYLNPTVNEMFIELKPKKDGKDYVLFPTFTLRQIPFTSKAAQTKYANKGIKSTAFVDLPRIKIPEKFIFNEDIGRSDNERINFIEVFGIYPSLDTSIGIEAQIAHGNYCLDAGSLKRYGVKALIPRTDYFIKDSNTRKEDAKEKDVVGQNSPTMIPKWIHLLADWWLGAHVFESGTIDMAGIEEPLFIGDNIEIVRESERGVNELYHIEGYTHSYGVEQATGKKAFRTSVMVSRGQRVDEYPIYVSGKIDEEGKLDIGLTDTELENTAKSTTYASGQERAITKDEMPTNPDKPSSGGGQ